MTITRGITHQMVENYNHFRELVDYAPEGTFLFAKQVNEVIDSTMRDMFSTAKELGVALDNMDGAYAIEVLMFDTIRQQEGRTLLDEAIHWGRMLSDASPATRARIINGFTPESYRGELV